MEQPEIPIYATLLYQVKQQLHISGDEYLLLDMVYHLQIKTGYCYKTPKKIGEDLDIPKRTVNWMITKLVTRGLVERLTDHTLRVTDVYISANRTYGQKLPTNEQELPTSGHILPSSGQELLAGGQDLSKKQGARLTYRNTIRNKVPKGTSRVSDETATVRRLYLLYLELFNGNETRYKLTDKRRAKLRIRLRDAGPDMVEAAIRAVASLPFYRGDNDRGWHADLDWIINSYERLEKMAGKGATEQNIIPSAKEALDAI